jgi:hypothetical protein
VGRALNFKKRQQSNSQENFSNYQLTNLSCHCPLPVRENWWMVLKNESVFLKFGQFKCQRALSHGFRFFEKNSTDSDHRATLMKKVLPVRYSQRKAGRYFCASQWHTAAPGLIRI